MLTVYKASAGSGKTFTLAYEYIKIILGSPAGDGFRLNRTDPERKFRRSPDRHRHILAITFTKAATAEMKSRIIKEIRKLTMLQDEPTPGESPYAGRLIAEYGRKGPCTRAMLRDAAGKALQELLNDYGNFNVSTIDSFFQSILRAFAREIDQQGDFEVKLERKEAILQGLCEMLDRINQGAEGNDSRMMRWLKDYMMSALSQGRIRNVFNRESQDLTDRAAEMDEAMDETYLEHADALKEFFGDEENVSAFKEGVDRTLGQYADAVRRAPEAYLAAIDSARSVLTSAKALAACKAPASIADRIAFLQATPLDRHSTLFNIKPAKKALGLIAEEPAPGDFMPAELRKAVDGTPEGAAILSGGVEMFRTAYRYRMRAQLLARLVDSLDDLQFLFMSMRYVEEYVRQSNSVLIADTGELISRIIHGSDTPFIYERVGMQLTNLLLDEFQDTSTRQWENLKPLVTNALATDNDCLIIGDVKQSIYGWRNSDPGLLDRQVEADGDFRGRIVSRGSLPEDNTNHRSSHTVVNFNNALFAAVAGELGVSGYSNVRQTPSPRLAAMPGYIKAFFSPGIDIEEVYGKVYADMKRQHEAGYRWSDILIIIRRNADGTRLVNWFRRNHPEVPFMSKNVVLLDNSPAVRTIISMLALVQKSYREDIGCREAEEAQKFASQDEIKDFNNRYHYFRSQNHSREDSVALALAKGGETQTIRDTVAAIRRRNPANLVALIEIIVACKLTPQARTAEHAYIAALQDLALAHEESADPSVEAFLEFYANRRKSLAIESAADMDAVQIMTIHRSKGLERPCVIIPQSDWDMVHKGGTRIWLPLPSERPAGGVLADLEKNGVSNFPPMLRLKLQNTDILLDSEASPEFADHCGALYRGIMSESVNNAYVAFTRARNELIVYCSHSAPADSDAAVPNFGKYFRSAIGGCPENIADQSGLNEGEFLYESGAPTLPQPGEPGAGDTPEKIIAPAYEVYNREDTRELVSVRDALSEDEGEDDAPADAVDPWDGTPEMKAAAEHGLRLHAVLAGMDILDDLESALERVALRLSLDRPTRQAYLTELREAFAAGGELVRGWFAPENSVFAERAIFIPASGATPAETLRPDRVIERDGCTTVVDYKFTRGVSPRHERQVRNYARILRLAGAPNVRAYLWYPLRGDIVEVKA